MNLAKRNILNYFLYCAFLFSISGKPTVAQNLSKTYFDESKNLIQNTKNNENWSRFAYLVNGNKGVHKINLSIVHIGDSHIQGGYYPNRFRELLSKVYGINQRGFVFPYSLVKANGPEDVKFYSTSVWSGEKYNHWHGNEKAGIAGYLLHLNDSIGMISIVLKPGEGPLFPFQELVIYHNNRRFNVFSSLATRTSIDSLGAQLYASHVFFKDRIDSVSLHFRNHVCNTQFFGFELRNPRAGIVYHSMGINGATFDTFINAVDYMSILKAVRPDCIIISLGTNDSYLKHVDTAGLKNKIITIVEKVKEQFPGACILLTTPGDHLIHKKYMNENLMKTSAVIIAVALEHQCAYWDFFSVMGGLGSSKRWGQHGLMYNDMLHLSKEGYKLQGDLFFEAFGKVVDEILANNR